MRLSHWFIPNAEIISSNICYCAGVGEDISFELGLIEQFGARVFAFDPTPRAIRFVEKQAPDPTRFIFKPVGLWSEDTTLRFFAPQNPEHVSHSVFKQGMRDEFFDAPCKKLSSLMREFRHDRLDLLKMNIEGAEYEVLETMLSDGIHPTVIALTFEGDSAFIKALRWTRRLRQSGYRIVGVNRWAVTFVLKDKGLVKHKCTE